MSDYIIQEFRLVLNAVLLGAILTFFYDWLRIMRRVIPHASWVVSLEDFVYWCTCFVVSFSMLYRENNGVMRWFHVIGAMIGMVLYKALLGRFFVCYMTKFFQIILRYIKKGLVIIGKPIYQRGREVRRRAVLQKRALEKKRDLCRKKLTHEIKVIKMVLKNK